MSKFREIILGNLPIKILSFTIAFIFWFVTMNVNNPITEKDITIYLDLKNENVITDKNYVIVNQADLEKTTIQVRIKGTRNDIISLQRYPDAITAYVDLSTVDLSNEATVGQITSVEVRLTNNYPDIFTIVTSYPQTVLLNIDVVETKTIPLYANVTGTPATSYILEGNPILDKSSITITGPKKVLDRVSKALLPINVDGSTVDIDETITPVVVDDNNIDVSGSIYSGLDPVRLVQKVAKATTVEIISPSLVGSLPTGRRLIEYTTDIQVIDVLADESNPNLSFNPIVLDPIEINDLTETAIFQEDITQKLADAGLKAENSEQTIVSTTLYIEADVELSLEVPLEQIEFTAVDYDYVVLNEDPLAITVSGPSTILETFVSTDMDLFCELPSNPETGEFTVNITATLPEELTITNMPALYVGVVQKEEVPLE